ncbi:MAG: DivIVA domain-containing protein [Gemmatimonadota bacterium]
MSNEPFRITPHDVRGQEFQRGFRGYEPAQVDAFKARLADELEQVFRERALMEDRFRNLQEQLKVYRERERALNEALVAAQQLRVDTREQAEREAAATRREAEREAETLLREARQEAHLMVEQAVMRERGIRERIEQAHGQYGAYVSSLRTLLERHLGEVAGLQALADGQLDDPLLR